MFNVYDYAYDYRCPSSLSGCSLNRRTFWKQIKYNESERRVPKNVDTIRLQVEIFEINLMGLIN